MVHDADHKKQHLPLNVLYKHIGLVTLEDFGVLWRLLSDSKNFTVFREVDCSGKLLDEFPPNAGILWLRRKPPLESWFMYEEALAFEREIL